MEKSLVFLMNNRSFINYNTHERCDKEMLPSKSYKEERNKSIYKRLLYLFGFIFFLAVEVLIALFVHDKFVRPYIGDVLVVVVIYLFVRIFIPEECKFLPILIFAFAVGVEVCQFFHIVERLGLSDYIFLRVLIGATFDVKDIVCYGVGIMLIQMIV